MPDKGEQIAPRWPFILLAIAVMAGSLGFRSAYPPVLNPSAYDDLLFLHLAESLRHGEWLGPYNKLTLIKGIGYPLFIAGVSAIHIPLKIAEHLVYLASAGAIAALIYRLSRSRVLAFMLLILLAYNPILNSADFAAVVRESLYISLVLGLFATVIAALAPGSLISGPRYRSLIFATLGGLVGGLLWITREEVT